MIMRKVNKEASQINFISNECPLVYLAPQTLKLIEYQFILKVLQLVTYFATSLLIHVSSE